MLAERSPGVAMSLALDRCRRYAGVRRPVIFVGPVGAGKTTLARHIHELSGRTGPFVAVTAAEASAPMYRDTLFGHVRGAFTGAVSGRIGAIERAAHGTLLIDDLAFLPLDAQAAILRVMEERSFYPIGADTEREVCCQILFASTVPLPRLVESGRLIPDLQSRMGEFIVPVPGLAERRDEIPSLSRDIASAFRVEHGQIDEVDFTDRALELLKRYDWPTNIRGLRNAIERAVVHAGLHEDLPVIEPDHLPDRVVAFEPDNKRDKRVTRSMVLHALSETNSNQSRAAERLGVHRNTVSRWIRKMR